jgi:hypothetical protein
VHSNSWKGQVLRSPVEHAPGQHGTISRVLTHRPKLMMPLGLPARQVGLRAILAVDGSGAVGRSRWRYDSPSMTSSQAELCNRWTADWASSGSASMLRLLRTTTNRNYAGSSLVLASSALSLPRSRRCFIAVEFPSLRPLEPHWQNTNRAPWPNWIITFARARHVPLVPHPCPLEGHETDTSGHQRSG